MTEIRPFRALRFARDPGKRIAPPYDVIDAAQRERLAAVAENVVHVTLPPGEEGQRDYKSAAAVFRGFLDSGALVRDPTEHVYVLEENTEDGRSRRGFLALLRLADYDEGVVLPHERTMKGPKHDRLQLTRELRANVEPLFFVYEDRSTKLAPLLEAALHGDQLASCEGPDGTGLRLHALASAREVGQLTAFLADRPVVIADGHHRYETMLSYRQECRAALEARGEEPSREAPHEFVLAYLVNAFDPGSSVRAIHRVLRGQIADLAATLEASGFASEELSDSLDSPALIELLARRTAGEHAFIFALPGGRMLLAHRPRGESLDVEVLHDDLLPRLGGELQFDSRPERLLATLRDRQASLGVLLNPVDPEALFRVVQSGARLPQKSTFFSPKIPSGLVLRDFD